MREVTCKQNLLAFAQNACMVNYDSIHDDLQGGWIRDKLYEWIHDDELHDGWIHDKQHNELYDRWIHDKLHGQWIHTELHDGWIHDNKWWMND